MKVTPHDHLRYMVKSDSGDTEYLVDLLLPECSCVDHQVRVKGGEKDMCKHEVAAHIQNSLDLINNIRQQIKK